MSQRVVLITGGAGGIGAALSAGFRDVGDDVVIADVDPVRVNAAAAASGARGVTMDITSPQSVAAALEEIGSVDVLVNNAGMLDRHGPVLALPVDDFDAIFAVNVHGTFVVLQAVARRMVDAGRGGAIVSISSIGARQPTPGMGAYEASKAALDQLTRWAAVELAEHGIRVNAVAPGPVLTPMLGEAMPDGSPAKEAWVSRIPLRRFAAIEDVAAAAVFLASDAAAHITGVSLPVDGGQLLT